MDTPEYINRDKKKISADRSKVTFLRNPQYRLFWCVGISHWLLKGKILVIRLCLFVVQLESFLHSYGHHYWRKFANFWPMLCTLCHWALKVLYSLPHCDIYCDMKHHLQGTLTITPVAECLAMKLSELKVWFCPSSLEENDF